MAYKDHLHKSVAGTGQTEMYRYTVVQFASNWSRWCETLGLCISVYFFPWCPWMCMWQHCLHTRDYLTICCWEQKYTSQYFSQRCGKSLTFLPNNGPAVGFGKLCVKHLKYEKIQITFSRPSLQPDDSMNYKYYRSAHRVDTVLAKPSVCIFLNSWTTLDWRGWSEDVFSHIEASHTVWCVSHELTTWLSVFRKQTNKNTLLLPWESTLTSFTHRVMVTDLIFCFISITVY